MSRNPSSKSAVLSASCPHTSLAHTNSCILVEDNAGGPCMVHVPCCSASFVRAHNTSTISRLSHTTTSICNWTWVIGVVSKVAAGINAGGRGWVTG
jgi:hypothetical protein